MLPQMDDINSNRVIWKTLWYSKCKAGPLGSDTTRTMYDKSLGTKRALRGFRYYGQTAESVDGILFPDLFGFRVYLGLR